MYYLALFAKLMCNMNMAKLLADSINCAFSPFTVTSKLNAIYASALTYAVSKYGWDLNCPTFASWLRTCDIPFEYSCDSYDDPVYKFICEKAVVNYKMLTNTFGMGLSKAHRYIARLAKLGLINVERLDKIYVITPKNLRLRE